MRALATRMTKLALIITLIGFQLCSKTQDSNERYEALLFEVNYDLLDELFQDAALSLQFAPPKNWKRLDAELFSQFINSSTISINDSSQFAMTAREIFFDSQTKSMCVISIFENIDPEMRFEDFIAEFSELAQSHYNQKLKKTGFSLINNLKFYQLIIMDDSIVNFKLLEKNNVTHPIQIDYITTVGQYPDLMKAIESSMGSITQFPIK